MLTTVAIVVMIILALGMLVTVRTRGRTVKMVYIIPLWIAAACAVILGGAAVWYASTLRTYDQCMARVDRAVGSRAQTLQLYDTIDALTGHPRFTNDAILPGLPSLRAALDINLPVLSISDCHHP